MKIHSMSIDASLGKRRTGIILDQATVLGIPSRSSVDKIKKSDKVSIFNQQPVSQQIGQKYSHNDSSNKQLRFQNKKKNKGLLPKHFLTFLGRECVDHPYYKKNNKSLSPKQTSRMNIQNQQVHNPQGSYREKDIILGLAQINSQSSILKTYSPINQSDKSHKDVE